MGFSRTKTPTAVKQYTFDWSPWLSTGETISTTTVIPDAGVTVSNVTHDNTTVTFRVSGGTSGNVYTITNHIVTSAAEENDSTLILDVRTR